MIFNKRYSIADNVKLMEQIRIQVSELENIEFNEDKVLQLEHEIEIKKHEKEELNEKILEINSQMAALKSKNESNKELEKKMTDLEICPTCLQNVDSVYRANIMNNCHSDTFENNKKIEIFESERKIY